MAGTSAIRTEALSREECIELLSYNSFVGRLGFVVDGQPYILPVNYLYEDGSIVFCTEAGLKLDTVGGWGPVAFEVDSIRPLYHSGWSVLVRGVAHEVTDFEELDRLRRGPLRSWATPPSAHWVRISVGEVSGRRIPES